MKSYSKLIKLPTFEERFDYLKLSNGVGIETFGAERYLNQTIYWSAEWKRVRRDVIIRDNGCDLGIEDRPIQKGVFVHHINPITVEDIIKRSKKVFDMNNLITVSFDTHQAIHYGNKDQLIPSMPTERKPNDQCPWRH